jgi:DnaK suppressor protein
MTSAVPSEMPYSAEFLQSQRERLLRERQRILDDIGMLSQEMRNWSQHDDAGIDQHMADDATALNEQEMDVTLLSSSQTVLSEIEDAMRRMDEGTYGWDEECRCWIREERLRALPYARREIAGQRRLEDRLDPEAADEEPEGGIARPF